MQLIREVAEKTAVKGARALRDQLYPVKVDGANRTAVLNLSGNVLPGAAEALGKENDMTIPKMHWLSGKENRKTYGSMVVYVTKASDARRLLEERYFHLARERPTAIGSSQSALSAEDRTSHSVETVGSGNSMAMCTNLRIFQSNVRKRDVMQLSIMNDRDLQDYAVLTVAEPYALNIDGAVVMTPNGHRNWINDLEAEQVSIPSADLTGAILRWPDREVLVIAVYVEGKDEQALRTAMMHLHMAITSFRNSTGQRTDVILAGDFNRHDQL
ncbi:RNA-directed DNA polymerase from mobile element jockey [Fusarium oxysporum f. sp. albedinis]|nr:RNA-directed DNA polymerase from mobile element jockey [Fusarium oxysporum f. sp. albedinis]